MVSARPDCVASLASVGQPAHHYLPDLGEAHQQVCPLPTRHEPGHLVVPQWPGVAVREREVGVWWEVEADLAGETHRLALVCPAAVREPVVARPRGPVDEREEPLHYLEALGAVLECQAREPVGVRHESRRDEERERVETRGDGRDRRCQKWAVHAQEDGRMDPVVEVHERRREFGKVQLDEAVEVFFLQDALQDGILSKVFLWLDRVDIWR